jgi:hypothetical protein
MKFVNDKILELLDLVEFMTPTINRRLYSVGIFAPHHSLDGAFLT